MLIEFSVENFRSIKEKQTLSMLSAGKVNEHPDNVAEWGNLKLTKSAIIYGRNASGKSNLLRAMVSLSRFVQDSVVARVNENISFYEPFRLNKEWNNRPTSFEVDFIGSNNIRYQYQILFSNIEILSESLFYYPNKQRSKLFVREKGKAIDFGISLKGDKKGIERQLLKNQLFLSRGANSNIQQLVEPYVFLLLYSFSFEHLGSDDVADIILSRKILEEKDFNLQSNIEKLLKIADVGITSIHPQEVFDNNFQYRDESPESINREKLNKIKYEMKFKHNVASKENSIEETDFTIKDESTGTVKLLGVGGRILKVLKEGEFIIIDELDKSLHPLLTRVLVKLFHNPKTNPKNAQLIFATHDISLLDNELFRRDQIWFTEKESDGATKVYSLSDFNGVRKDIPYDKWYMSGRFGAIPSINESELNLEF